jgi:ATP phosphoribosyltransferase
MAFMSSCQQSRALQVQVFETSASGNQLKEVEVISQISSRLVVNQAAYKRRRADLQPLLDAFSKV